MCSSDCFIHFRGCLFPPLSQRFGIGQFQISDCLFRDLQTIALQIVALDLLRHVTGIVVFAGAESRSTEATTSCGGRPARARLTAPPITSRRTEIRSIKTVAFKTITNRAIDQIMARELAVIRRGIGIMIVSRDDYERHLLYCGDIHSS